MINIIKETQLATAQAQRMYQEKAQALEKLEANTYIVIMPYCQKVQVDKDKWTFSPKNYPYWTELIEHIKRTYPTTKIVQVGATGEQVLPLVDTTKFNLTPDELKILVANSITFISGDTYLQHLAMIANKKGIVLWGQNNPAYFGYEMHDNLYVSSKYFRDNAEVWFVWNYVKRVDESFVKPSEVMNTLSTYLISAVKEVLLPWRDETEDEYDASLFHNQAIFDNVVDKVIQETKDTAITKAAQG